MTRALALLIAAVLLVPTVVFGQSWQPATKSAADWLAEMERKLVPIHAGMNTALDEISLASTKAEVDAYATVIQETAKRGFVVVDATPVMPCYASYWAIERTMFLLFGDAIDSFRAEDPALDRQVNAAIYLLTEYADLERGLVSCETVGPPAPTTVPIAPPTTAPRKTPTPERTTTPEATP